ncbi:MAG: CopD family protein [Burkholderiales bacterium]
MTYIFLCLHLLSVAVWVGGMFFAYVALRPAAAKMLEAPERLNLWSATFARFFLWVWIAVALILLSGFGMISTGGGFKNSPLYVNAMMAAGLVMMAIFAHVYFAPYQRLVRYVAAREWKAAGEQLAQIRKMVGLNLALGLLTITVATVGHLFAV